MMRIGIVCNIDNFYNVREGDSYNYIKFISDYLSKNNEVGLFDWRDVSEDLIASRALILDGGSYLSADNLSLNNYDVVFVKQLGKIHLASEDFLKFLNYLESYEGRVLNPIDTIRDNLSKDYLLSMQDDGLPVVPTSRLSSDATLSEVRAMDFGLEGSKGNVVKPCSFGEQGQGVCLVNSFGSEEEFSEYMQKNFPVIVQPVVPGIYSDGEYSLVFLGKEFSHGVRKHTGDFKINFTAKSVYEEYVPTDEELALAKSILEYWPKSLGYSRIDFMRYDGKPLVSEVEMVNPAFYVENLEGVGERFVKDLEAFFGAKDE